MQKHLSQPIFTSRSVFMWIYIHASADDMVGITNQKKKYRGVFGHKSSIFWNKILWGKKKNVCNVDADAEMPDAHADAEILVWSKTSSTFVFYISNQ